MAEAGPDEEDLPRPVRGVVEVEEPVEREAATRAPSVVTVRLLRPQAEPAEAHLAEVRELVADDANLVWIDLSNYSAEDLRAAADTLRLDPRGVRIALAAWQRPRLELLGGHFFASATLPRVDHEALRVRAGQLDLFVGRNFLVSAHKQPLPFVEHVMTRVHENPEVLRLDSAYLLYVLLDELLGHYARLSEAFENQIEEMQERALVETSDAFLSSLARLKRYVFAVERLATQHREVFAAFLRPDFPFITREDTEPYYRDLEDRLARLIDSLGAAEDDVNAAFDVYVSQVSHRTNQVMKVLTVVSTIVLPTSVILGIFGTQFQGVPFLYAPVGFYFMMATILLVPLLVLFIFRRLRWI